MFAERELDSPIGPLTLCADEAGIFALRFGAAGGRMDDAPLLITAQRELEEYFAGRRRRFSVPLSMRGSAFQCAVWRALAQIPWGETITYGELARRVGNPKACRAVGMANHANPLPIFVPCHRVLGANGRLTGYAGGLEAKRILLEIEGVHVEV